MRHALILLQRLIDEIPPAPGCSHALTIQDGALLVTIMVNKKWQSFKLDDADLTKSGEVLAADVLAIWKASV